MEGDWGGIGVGHAHREYQCRLGGVGDLGQDWGGVGVQGRGGGLGLIASSGQRAVDPQLIPINRRVDGIAPVHVAVGVDLLRVGVN